MRPKFKRFVAALVGAATLITPVSAFADGYCATYTQVESGSGGGTYVGGLLIYETTAEITRSDPQYSVTTTVSSSSSLGVPGSSVGTTTTVSTTSTTASPSRTTEEPVGYYRMNDGSIYQINCLTGEASKLA